MNEHTKLLPARAASVRVFSYGGGVQSNAVLALQALGKLRNPYDYFVFANVGEDSENPETLEYIEQYAKPFAEKHEITFLEVRKLRFGEPDTLYQHVMRQQKSVSLPMYMGGNGAPGRRACTTDFKIRVVDKFCKLQGGTFYTVGLGISMDEALRMRDAYWHDTYGKRSLGFWKRREYPLIQLHMSRADCLAVLSDAGLPPAPKSSCFFCPYHSPNSWIELKRERPDLFERTVEMERHIHEVRGTTGRDAVYFHRALVPLDQAVGDQLPMFPEWEMDNCESGYCMV